MPQLRDLVENGMDFPVAFKAILGKRSITSVAKAGGVHGSALSGYTNGTLASPYEQCAAIIAEVSGEELEWVKEQGRLQRAQREAQRAQAAPAT